MSDRHPQEQCIFVWTALRHVHNRINAQLEMALRDQCALSISEFDAMAALHFCQPATITVNALAEAVNLSQPATSRLLDRLEHRGWITRQRSEDDTRQICLQLTDSGRQQTAGAISLHGEIVRENLSAKLSSEDHQKLLTILSRLTPPQSAPPAIPAPADRT
jgi:DNA-binding MarR family transcriptional regulator